MTTKKTSGRVGRISLAVCAVALSAIALSATAVSAQSASLAYQEIPEDELLDVGITILNPGLPPHDENAAEDDGVFADLRKAEARFIPVRLMETLQATGYWGAVRVVPQGSDNIDVMVSGTILESGGRKLELRVRAADVSGRQWFERTYKHVAEPRAYAERDDGTLPEPFRAVYSEIANDLLEMRNKLKPEERKRLHELAQLRFAADLVPAAFDDYLKRDRKGRWVVAKLPAEGDPMMSRIDEIRERDDLFVDMLTEHYANFVLEMEEPYDNWRQFAYEEEMAQRQLKRQARTQKILGALAIIGAVVMDGDSEAERVIQQGAVIGGTMAIQAGMSKSQEVKMHVESLRELASSFDSEVEPLLVDVEGQTLRLSGSVETQFVTWRKLLRDIFLNETGLVVDPDSGAEVTSDSP